MKPAPAVAAPCGLLVALATYDEATNLSPLVEAIREQAPHASILVIDDNSPDGTGRIADELRATLPDIHVIHRSGKLGLGTAVLTAMKFAIDNGYDYFLNLDADFSHPPRFIPAILAGMAENDVMIGSRYIPGGGVEGDFDLKRKFMSTGINVYARLFLGLRTRDNSGSYRCYRVSKLRQIDLGRVRSRGYSFMEEILYWCRTVGCTFGETPILFENRRSGYSKINAREAIKALQIIFELGVSRIFGRTRLSLRSDRGGDERSRLDRQHPPLTDAQRAQDPPARLRRQEMPPVRGRLLPADLGPHDRPAEPTGRGGPRATCGRGPDDRGDGRPRR
jgi:dolichol-phosphate mannosyltransferase